MIPTSSSLKLVSSTLFRNTSNIYSRLYRFQSSFSHPLPSGDNAFTKKSLFGSQEEMTYGGTLSFLRRRLSKNIFGHGENGDERADVVVSGIPFDSACTYRSGARLGPRAIRAASVQLGELLPYPWNFDPFEELAVVDYGDMFLDPHNPMTVPNSIMENALSIISAADPINNMTDSNIHNGITYSRGKNGHYGNFLSSEPSRPPRMLTFGGDHFVTYPLLKAHAEKYGPIALLHFDAHCDTWKPTSDNDINHGTMFYHAVHDGIIDPKKSIQIGLRTTNDDYLGMNIFDAIWVHKYGPDAVLEKIQEIQSGLPVYLTFDIDCLDPAYAPGTGTPVPGGLSSYQALHIIRGLKDTGIDVVGADVVEVAPSYDVSEITALSAAHVATDILCMWAYQKKQLTRC